ncbi:hypothetical protein, partial [Brevibacillus panacihumi]|uniref:hypothetical protein n=1 Tax=Brevibacillus panacihumi TaxID=497735 RepID=UPI003D1975DE
SSLLYTLYNIFELAAFGRGSAFGVETDRSTPSEDPTPPKRSLLFPLLDYSWRTTKTKGCG